MRRRSDVPHLQRALAAVRARIVDETISSCPTASQAIRAPALLMLRSYLPSRATAQPAQQLFHTSNALLAQRSRTTLRPPVADYLRTRQQRVLPITINHPCHCACISPPASTRHQADRIRAELRAHLTLPTSPPLPLPLLHSPLLTHLPHSSLPHLPLFHSLFPSTFLPYTFSLPPLLSLLSPSLYLPHLPLSYSPHSLSFSLLLLLTFLLSPLSLTHPLHLLYLLTHISLLPPSSSTTLPFSFPFFLSFSLFHPSPSSSLSLPPTPLFSSLILSLYTSLSHLSPFIHLLLSFSLSTSSFAPARPSGPVLPASSYASACPRPPPVRRRPRAVPAPVAGAALACSPFRPRRGHRPGRGVSRRCRPAAPARRRLGRGPVRQLQGRAAGRGPVRGSCAPAAARVSR